MNLVASPIAVASVSFLLAAVSTTVLVPQVRRFGLRFGWTDQPDERKQHITPMVRLGGVAMVLGFGLALAAVWSMGGFGLLAPARDQLIWGTLAGSLCFFLIGLAVISLPSPPGRGWLDRSPWPVRFGARAFGSERSISPG